MDRNPFLGDHAGRNPGPETEEVGERRMEIDAAMRLAAMQVQRDGKNRQLRDDQEIHAFCQPRGMAEAVIEEIENVVEHDVGIPQEGRANFGLYGSYLHPASAVSYTHLTLPTSDLV